MNEEEIEMPEWIKILKKLVGKAKEREHKIKDK